VVHPLSSSNDPENRSRGKPGARSRANAAAAGREDAYHNLNGKSLAGKIVVIGTGRMGGGLGDGV